MTIINFPYYIVFAILHHLMLLANQTRSQEILAHDYQRFIKI